MFDVAGKVARHRLLRSAAMVALVVSAALLAGCPQPAPPPPQPVAYQPPPPPAPPPPPPPAPVVGERG
jgi:hypothetical protein